MYSSFSLPRLYKPKDVKRKRRTHCLPEQEKSNFLDLAAVLLDCRLTGSNGPCHDRSQCTFFLRCIRNQAARPLLRGHLLSSAIHRPAPSENWRVRANASILGSLRVLWFSPSRHGDSLSDLGRVTARIDIEHLCDGERSAGSLRHSIPRIRGNKRRTWARLG